jgi:hypothetical protein
MDVIDASEREQLSLAALDGLIDVAFTSPKIFLIRSRDLRRLRQKMAPVPRVSAPEFFGRKRRKRRARGRNPWLMLRLSPSRP